MDKALLMCMLVEQLVMISLVLLKF